MKKFIYIYAFIMTFCLFSVAYSIDDYTTLSPLPGTTKCDSEYGTSCKTDLATYLPGLFKLIIGTGAGMAFVIITYQGLNYLLTNSFLRKNEAVTKITDAFVGLGLIICSYLIVYTINPKALELNLSIPRINLQRDMLRLADLGPNSLSGIGQNSGNEAEVRRLLTNNGITINNGPCPEGQTRGCTNVSDLPSTVTVGLMNAINQCSCNLTITGGTEGGHQTHGPNNPIVDLAPDQKLNSWLGAENPIERTQRTKRIGNVTAVFTFEKTGGNPNGTSSGDHWHVEFR